ncbi:lipase 3-like isoform X1 [Schistocerca americana]|uniref:lipase 3-like isoform X1 n=1 Tax=Schistocerca americana TaxID=7009 RepID=UPI001F5036BD|nr:lipase 3-like isoform X1 [Schistocerca americana]XP_047001405.1 lipase 3-like isoform X1 [Schistocerca americana]XP_047001406.1 lipase 3-like isoform X1 [Schistocerca americana]
MEPASLLSAAASLFLAALNLTSPPPSSEPPADPAVYATMLDGCRDYGLTCETHEVETEDGYQLTAHRVLVPPGVPRRGALLAVSGLIGCSDSFLLPFPETSMLKPLSNAGYDVMLGNLRGSAYTGHRRWSRSQPEYWRFSLDDMGEYDLEALVGLTQRVTGDARPFYLGHSSGGGALYTWLQRRPRAHHVLRGALLWTPSVFYTEPHSTIFKIYNLLPESLVRALWQVPGDMLPRSRATADIAWRMCRSGSPLRNFCEAMYQFITNATLDSADMNRLPAIAAHASCGMPTTTVAHYLQNIRAKRLQAFDFGQEENLSKYGSERPPAYHVVNSTLPTAFFLGTRDRLVSFEEAMRQIQMIPSNVKKMVVPLEGYGHFHIVFDKNVHRLVHEKMLSFMSEL